MRPDDSEKRVVQEVVIRLADRRVLNAVECCDDCIRQSLRSLQEIRSILVDKQVEMKKMTDSPLYLLVEFMLEAIRQFLTFEQRLQPKVGEPALVMPRSSDLSRPIGSREQYFAALEMLRAHLHRCLIQVSKIADVQIPRIADHMRYDEAWQLDAYESPVLPGSPGA